METQRGLERSNHRGPEGAGRQAGHPGTRIAVEFDVDPKQEKDMLF